MIVDSYDAALSAGSVGGIQNAEAKISPVAEKAAAPEKVEEKRPRIFTVSEITEGIKDLVEGKYVDIWVTGEVTDMKNRATPHLYFSLKDEKKNTLRAIIFGGGSRKFGFDIADGLEVICHGRMSVYGPGSNYSIVVDFIEPKGIGALQLAFEQMKKKLEAEGLFRKERKRPIPFLPRKIGVVTSPTGAAVKDIIHVLTRRFPNIEILVCPVKVQGEGAAAEIAEGIAAMAKRDDLDVLIVGRGGGSMEDLWAFNEEVVARAIAASRLPVISAVGHEIDFTIADFVADVRAATPSAAAELAVPERDELVRSLEGLHRQLALALRQGLEKKRQELHKLQARMRDPSKRFPDIMRGIDSLRGRLVFAVGRAMEGRFALLSKFASNLDHLSPLSVLAKGYSVVEDKRGRVVKDAAAVSVGDELKLKFSKGGAGAVVTKLFK
jgi:exodeoxyribonuclease VII large subunit